MPEVCEAPPWRPRWKDRWWEDQKKKQEQEEVEPPIPVFIPGADTPDTTLHIILAKKSRNYPLHRFDEYFNPLKPDQSGGWTREWLRREGRAAACFPRKGKGLSCDEYPFATTVEGGEHNAPSLALTLAREQLKQGGKLKAFYNNPKCPRQPVVWTGPRDFTGGAIWTPGTILPTPPTARFEVKPDMSEPITTYDCEGAQDQ
jgi:hypothetical protein